MSAPEDPGRPAGVVFPVETKKGNHSLRVRGEDGSERLLHSLYDPEREAQANADAFPFEGRGILVVLGLGLGYHVAALARKYPNAILVVVEALPEVLDAARTVGNASEWLDRVRLFVGTPAEELLRELSREQSRAGMVPLAVFALQPAVSASPGYYRPIQESLNRIQSVRLWEKLRYAKFREEACRVALIDFGYFLTREIEAAIQGSGHRVTRIPVQKGEEGSAIVSRVMHQILTFKPDFFLTVNHLGFDEDGVLNDFFLAIEMPVASWYVDSPNVIVRAFNRNVSPLTAIFLWDRGYMEDMRAMGFERVRYLPLGTDATIFRPLPSKVAPGKQAVYETGFVGNSLVGSTEEWMARVPGEVRPLVEKLVDAHGGRRDTLERLLERIPREARQCIGRLSKKNRMHFEAALLWKATQRYRLACVEQLKAFELRIHGDEGWQALLGADFKTYPPLDYYEDLPAFYNACRINFNATHLQMGEAVNQRVFDVPACGGFLLTDHQESLGELFEVGEEILTYREPGEIADLVRFYLDHPEALEAIAARGRRRVLREHTYQHRLEQILRFMKTEYAKR